MYFYAIWYWRILFFNFKETIIESFHMCENFRK